MSEHDREVFATERLMPRIRRFGSRDIEITYLGRNADGLRTWIMWNPREPFLIGMLIKGEYGYTFEQRTSAGVLVHKNMSLSSVQRALEQ